MTYTTLQYINIQCMDVSKTVFNVSQSLITVTNDGSYYYFFEMDGIE